MQQDRIYNIDCLNGLSHIEDESIDMIFSN